MRTIKQLLEVMLEHQDLFQNGLCYWVKNLYHDGIITFSEHKLLKNYIDCNKPSKYSSWDAYKGQTYRKKLGYYWEYGNIKPRINWIKKHIKLNS